MKNNLFVVLALSLGVPVLSGMGGIAHAEENGQQPYPGGLNTIGAGFVPALGHSQFYMYNQYANTTKFLGDGGKELFSNFHADSLAMVPRILYTLPEKAGPFSVTVGGSMTFLNLNMKTPGGDGHIFGICDLDPEVRFGWNNRAHNFFLLLGMDVFVPTGSYSQTRIANLGLNYWTFQPNISFTYFINRHIALENATVLNLNTTNGSTEYHSGANIVSDYAVNYYPDIAALPNLYMGVAGYVQEQIQNDTHDGQVVDNIDGIPVSHGFRGEAVGIGPQVGLRLFRTGGILLKYTHQFSARNVPQGEEFWFEWSVPLS